MGLHRFDQIEGVAVGADGSLPLGCSQQMWGGRSGVAGFDQVVAHSCRRRAQRLEMHSSVAVDAAAPMGRHIGGQGVTDQAVPELVVRSRVLDDAGVKSGIEMGEGVVIGQAGERHELLGIESRAEHGDPLQDLSGSGAEGGESDRVSGLLPRRGAPARRASSTSAKGDPFASSTIRASVPALAFGWWRRASSSACGTDSGASS